MNGVHRRIVAAIVGLAAILGVVALSRTAALGPDGPSTQPAAAALTTTVAGGTDAGAAAKELAKARADLKKAIAERNTAKTTPQTRTVVEQAPAATPASQSWGDDHYEHGDEGEHGEDD